MLKHLARLRQHGRVGRIPAVVPGIQYLTVWSTVHTLMLAPDHPVFSTPGLSHYMLDSSLCFPQRILISLNSYKDFQISIPFALLIFALQNFTIVNKTPYWFALNFCLWSHPWNNVTEDQTDTDYEHRNTCYIRPFHRLGECPQGIFVTCTNAIIFLRKSHGHAGNAAECSVFLRQVDLYIRMQHFTTESSKVAFLISLLSGSSLVQEYTIHFSTLAAASGWNEVALLSAYRQELNLEIRAASFTTSNRLPATYNHSSVRVRLCLYCGNNGHFIRNCPVKPPCPVVGSHSTTTSSAIGLCHRAAAWSSTSQGENLPTVLPECQAMEEYIAETLQQGFIQPSTSPAVSSSFFVGKKDGGLQPCIDYRQLNSQIIQQPYPLPLVPAALEELRGVRVFSKLDLRSAYNLTRIRVGDEWKTAFITPTGHYEYRVMPYGLSISPLIFQTFMNEVFQEFLHRFVIVYIDDILIYSRNLAHPAGPSETQRTLPLPKVGEIYVISVEGVQMNQGKIQAIQEWTTPNTVKELQRFLGFSNFYRRFIQNYRVSPHIWFGTPRPTKHSNGSSAPLLYYITLVEVDASTTGVGAVLSQAVAEPPLLHPCAYFSRKLSPVEQNYYVGNRELLAIKLSMEERHHWLEGTRNITADALSRQFSADSPAEPETILPPNVIVSPIVWDLDHNIRNATLQEPALPGCPEGKIYVPHSQCLNLLGTAHVSPGSGHPGSRLTLLLLQARYWWPSMHRDITRKTGTTSYATEALVPYRRLPTALETAKHLFQHVFRNWVTGLPEEIVSDRGPQFICYVWKAFFKLLGISVNLSSGYHPQTNDQTERKIQELGCYLWSYCQEDQHSWSRFLPWAEYAQNSFRQDTTGLKPFQCILGFQPLLFPWTEEPSNVPAVDHWFRASERVWNSAHHHLQRAVRRHNRFADTRRREAPQCQPGDQVWLSTHDLRLRLPCRKLSPRYIGPFKILRQINDVTHQLQLPPRYRIHPTFHVSLLKPFSPSATDTTRAEAELQKSWTNTPALLLKFHQSYPDCPGPSWSWAPSTLC
ncbi:Transposon Tf2-11 polyprotein [Labeo rohita]|uniref:Gypsy retrotransposon integrase-like protein 1 n=1 Tax=Labeo rohita TaxID=84645 RepID=A0ABQ8M9H5_LABRO|nr:Transposon Tf2-11 polyprotein [Labeo rohita]